ncbi:MAG: hypothetical protein ACTSXK_00470 [Promethearchaeota archaeon]
MWFTLSSIIPIGLAFKEPYPTGTFTTTIEAGSRVDKYSNLPFAYEKYNDFHMYISFEANSSVCFVLFNSTQYSKIGGSSSYLQGQQGVDFLRSAMNVKSYSDDWLITDNLGYHIIISNEQSDTDVRVTVNTDLDELSTNAIYFGFACAIIAIGLVVVVLIKKKLPSDQIEKKIEVSPSL